MTTINIQYSSLEDAAKTALNIATGMNSYADAIPKLIVAPLESLSGGASTNTSTVQSLASQKASSLRQRALRYQNLSSQITSFIESAREIDTQVKTKIASIADKQAEALSWGQSIWYEACKLFNGLVGDTELGAMLNNLLSSISGQIKERIRDIAEWFQYGNGRYVLNITVSVLGTAGAIAGAVLSFPASGVFATIVGVAAATSAVVSVFDTWATVTEGTKALSLNDTHPGVARYYGNTTSLSDLAKKNTTNATWQSLASGADTIKSIAGAVSFFGGGFITTVGKNGAKVGTLDIATVKSNFAKNFGFSFDAKTNSYSFAPKTLFGFGKQRTEGYLKGSIFHTAETVQIVADPISRIGATLQTTTLATAANSSLNKDTINPVLSSLFW